METNTNKKEPIVNTEPKKATKHKGLFVVGLILISLPGLAMAYSYNSNPNVVYENQVTSGPVIHAVCSNTGCSTPRGYVKPVVSVNRTYVTQNRQAYYINDSGRQVGSPAWNADGYANNKNYYTDYTAYNPADNYQNNYPVNYSNSYQNSYSPDTNYLPSRIHGPAAW